MKRKTNKKNNKPRNRTKKKYEKEKQIISINLSFHKIMIGAVSMSHPVKE